MLTPWEFEQQLAGQARALKAAALTPAHSAAEGAMDGGEDGADDQAEEVRRRIQHEADPLPPDAPEVERADLDKAYRQAFSAPTGYPAMARVSPESFRRGPVTAGEAAYGPAYDVSARPVPVPAQTLSAAMSAEGC